MYDPPPRAALDQGKVRTAWYSGTYTEAQYAAWLAARKVGAYLTHRARTTRTACNLDRAVGELLLAGKRPSVAAVARKINKSREHVSRRYGRERIARAVQAWRALHSKAHQKHIRDSHANEPDLFIEEKRELAASLKNAWVREVGYREAAEIILKYEWLGNMGTTRHCFGLFFGDYLAGVTCFGITGGTRTAESVCGPEHASKVATLVRGACVHWAHPHSASFLISKSCRLMAEHGKHIFVAYSDPAAGEVGTVYQACSWLYCGTTAGGTRNQQFRWLGGKQPRLLCPCGCGQPMPPSEAYDGRPRDEREVHNYTRAGQVRVEQDMLDIDFPTDNRPGNERYRQHCTRAVLKKRMLDAGFVFEPGRPKHRYVGIYGPAALTKELAAALTWAREPYPKRHSTT